MAPRPAKERGDRAQAMETCAALVIGIIGQLPQADDQADKPEPERRRRPSTQPRDRRAE